MHTFWAMNTTFSTVGLPHDSQKKVESWITYVEQQLSRFQPQSELSRLNQSNGYPFFASALLYEVLSEADRSYKETDGIFNPYMGKNLMDLGYDRSFEKLSERNGDYAFAYQICRQNDRNEKQVSLTQEKTFRHVQLHNGTLVDLGGIAKGWSVYKIQHWLLAEGLSSGLINAGGDIAAWGTDQSEKPWGIGIVNPFEEERDAAAIWLNRNAGVATSGTHKRRWKQGEEKMAHHILDPRTGLSAVSDLIQATVIAPDLVTAEVYAKCLLIQGSEQGPRWMEQIKPGLGYVMIKSDGSIVSSQNMNDYCMEYEVYK